MRAWLWNLVYSRLSPAKHLPPWARAVRAILYPIEYLCWRQSQLMGYDYYSYSIRAEGVLFSVRDLKMLAKAEEGALFRATSSTINGVTRVSIEWADRPRDLPEGDLESYKVAQIRALIER